MTANCMTDLTPSALPTTADLADALEAIDSASDRLVHIQWLVLRIARGADPLDDAEVMELVEGDEIPTFAHIGELSVFVGDVRSRLGEIERWMDTIESRLTDLDTVRRMSVEAVA